MADRGVMVKVMVQNGTLHVGDVIVCGDAFGRVKSMDDTPRRVAFVPHALLVGWVSEKEVLIVEDHLLVLYNIGTATRRKSSVRVEDAGHAFLR